MISAVVFSGLVALAISFLGCGLALFWASRRGWVDAVGGEAHKQHTRPVPNLGGIGIFVGVVTPILGAVALAIAVGTDPGSGGVAEHLPGLRSVAPAVSVVLLALLALHVTGLIDDRKRLPAWPKLLVQAAAAVAVVVVADVRALTLLDDALPGGPGYALSVALTVAWLIAITNAVNFLDNMDGLAGGVAAIVAAAYLAMAWLAGQWFVAAAAAAVLGACLGFLAFNLPPAKLFMGDGGSLVLGFLLAVIAVRTTYFSPGLTGVPADGIADATHAAAVAPGWHGVLTPLIVLAVPLYDLASVTLLRLSQGRPPWVGDHQHVSHRLAVRDDATGVGLGLGRRHAVAAVWLCTAATAAGGVLLPRLGPLGAAVVATQTAAILGLLALIERPWQRLGRPTAVPSPRSPSPTPPSTHTPAVKPPQA